MVESVIWDWVSKGGPIAMPLAFAIYWLNGERKRLIDIIDSKDVEIRELITRELDTEKKLQEIIDKLNRQKNA